MNKLKVLAVALAILALSIIVIPAQAKVTTFTCNYTHSLPDDPIVFPGVAGASHLHGFFGNPSVNANSTADSISAIRNDCTAVGDHSGYWAPATYVNGVRSVPSKIGAYWRSGGLTGLEPVPFGMKFVSHTYGWACTNGQMSPTPIDCTATGKGVTIRMVYPNCWDGLGVEPVDFAYSPCPTGFDHHIPQLIFILQPRLPSGARMYNPAGISFASGAWTTVHSDFLNAFEPAAMAAIVAAIS